MTSQAELDAGMPHTYTRRQAQVEAIQWLGWNTAPVADFLRFSPAFNSYEDGCATVEITSEDGSVGLTASTGDYIVRADGVLTVWSQGMFDYLYQEA